MKHNSGESEVSNANYRVEAPVPTGSEMCCQRRQDIRIK